MGDTTCLHLIRHGQVEGYERKRYNGQSEVALTEVGLNQYRMLAGRLRHLPLTAVYSSDLERCLVGARMIAEEHGIPMVPLTELRELHAGCWEGQPWDDIVREHPELWQARLHDIVHVPPPEGESIQQLAERALPAIRWIVARHPGEQVLVVGHGGVNRVILLDAIGAPLSRVLHIEQSYAAYNRIDYRRDGSASVHCLNG